MLTVGLGGVSRNGCVAICDEATVVGVCEQERVTRVRSAGFNQSGLPDEALDTLLERAGHRRSDIGRYIAAEAGVQLGSNRLEHLDHHLAHAATAYLTSPFSSAVIVVCDHDAPKVSVWEGRGADIARVDWSWNGPGFSDIYSACTQLIGFSSNGGDQRLEALAGLNPDARDQRVDRLLSCDGTALVAEPDWKRAVEILRDGRTGLAGPADAPLAAALQARIGELVVSLLQVVRTRSESPRLCLGGSFFYHSSMNTAVKTAGLFTDVFVPVDPGNSGLAVGAALHATHNPPSPVSPFLGPSYSSDEIKEVLDNCKLQYEWRSEEGVIAAIIDALRRGLLVGWFDSGMEWGPRALGARCIMANPFSPYVLENLNRFLKHREPWRGYAISGLEHAVGEHLDGPTSAPFMECDYRPRDRSRFAHMLPSSSAAIRVQTVGSAGSPRFRFRLLLEAFGRAVGLPFILNTSFNGFHEPIVCNPRDAVRVFYGTGIDLLVLGQFLLRK